MTSSSGSTVGPALARWAGARLLPDSDVPCAAPFVTLEFGAYGMVQACCANALYPIGDVRHQTIQEIWDGYRVNQLRDAFRRGDLGPGCGVCRFRLLHTPGELPRNYSLAVYYPGGNQSTSGSTTQDRTMTITAKAGQPITIQVSVGTGGFSATAPYRRGVSPAG